MGNQELKQYLKDVYELEKQLYTLNTLKSEMEDQLEKFNKQKSQDIQGNEVYLDFDEHYVFRANNVDTLRDFAYKNGYCLNEHILPQKWQKNSTLKNLLTEMKTKFEKTRKQEKSFKFLKILMCVIGIILTFILCNSNILVSILFSVVICGVIITLVPTESKKQVQEFVDARNKVYEIFKKIYEDDLEQKFTWNNNRCVHISDKYQNVIIPAINETETTLRKIYEKNIIHPKYRHFIAVAQIYEYLDTGRCNELEGPNGAYNLYEQELNSKIIINKLDIVISQLEQLNRTMSYVAIAVNKTNTLLYNACSTLNTIETNTAIMASNSAITAYNTQCIAFNSECMIRYN